jgi:hypothetical protein
MRGLSNIFQSLLTALGIENQPWIGPIVFVVLLALIWPYLQRNLKTDRGRQRIRGLADMPLPERQKAQDEALQMIGEEPDGLVALADESLRQGDRDYARRVVDRLKATGKKKDHVRRLDALLVDRNLQLPEQTVIAVERLLDTGLLEPARQRLAPALERWPDHPELLALRARIEAGEVGTKPVADEDEEGAG